MAYDLLLSFINDLGYFALFLVLCLGLIGLPIPNEAVVMTGGALAASGLLAPTPAYLMTFLGICSSMSFNYAIGRFAGSRLFNWFMQKKNIIKFVHQAERLNDKYGGFALGIGLLLPVLRHVMPFVTGTNKMAYKKFALFAYPSAFCWTLLYFILGTIVGENVRSIGEMIYSYGMIVVYILLGIALLALIRYFIKARSAKDDKVERHL